MKKPKFVVYIATNRKTKECYIGATSRGLVVRKQAHLRNARGGNEGCPRLYRAIRKYGEENFSWRVLGQADSINQLMVLEVELIEKLRPEYNVTKRGKGVIGVPIPKSKEWREMMSKVHKGRRPSPKCILAAIKNHRTTSVICLNDGKFFKSIKSAAEFYKISANGIGEVLHKRQNHCGGFSFVYSKRRLRKVEIHLLAEKREAIRFENRSKVRRKATICLNFGTTHKSVKDAGIAHRVPSYLVAASCVQKIPVTARRLEFRHR